jgi:transposase InsO family protein
MNPPVLAMADFSQRFVLQTDASSVALGAVLMQEVGGQKRPIAFASRTLSNQERKFSAYELECLAVLFGVEKFRMYLEHVEFDLETDNQALSWCLAHPRQTGRIARWVVRLSAFKFIPHHIKGTLNVVADALSRMFDGVDTPDLQPSIVAPVLYDMPLAFTDLQSHQTQDLELQSITQKLEQGVSLSPYSVRNGLLYCTAKFDRKPKVVLPQHLIPVVFKFYHESPVGGHLGVYKTLHKIRQYFIWKHMDHDVKTRVKACKLCCLSKPAQSTRVGLLASEVASTPMEKLFIDYVGPFPRSRSGNAYALVAVDAFSKFSWIFPVRRATSSVTIGCLKSIFANFGVCQHLVSDNGTQFTSREFRHFVFGLGIHHYTTTPYYPNPSHAERFNRNLKSTLIAYHHHDHSLWDSELHWLQFAFNSAQHESLKCTPVSLMLGFSPNNPLSNVWSLGDLLPNQPDPVTLREVWNRARRNLARARDRVRRGYDRNRRPNCYSVGQLVMVRNYPQSRAIDRFSAKLAPRYRGPFRIERFLTPVTVRLTNVADNMCLRAHLSQLKPA